MATKSHFCEAMLSMAARCLVALSSPSNHVTSTLNSLPQYSAARLPWAHQVACSPALEKAALRGFVDRPASFAIAAIINGLNPSPPKSPAAAPAETDAILNRSRREVPAISLSLDMFLSQFGPSPGGFWSCRWRGCCTRKWHREECVAALGGVAAQCSSVGSRDSGCTRRWQRLFRS